MSLEICCANCQYFSPGDDGCPSLSISKKVFDEFTLDTNGICRINPPVAGDESENDQGEFFRGYGVFPKIFGSDWCGKFKVHEFHEE